MNTTNHEIMRPFLYKFGTAIALRYVVQMLFLQPTGLVSNQRADNRALYVFGGITNTAARVRGKRRIGGAIISAGIYVKDKQCYDVN